jgi:glutamate-1-semialdehyde 2,1-aminomutase
VRTISETIFEKLCRVIPGGVNSPVRSFNAVRIAPMVVESGAGALIRDVDGHEYIDYCGSWGPLILGHAHPEVVAAAQKQMATGCSFGITSEIEEMLASKIVGLLPPIEKIRFVSSGTEATMTALRIARGVTKRAKIVKFSGHYHGHHDSLLVQAGSGVSLLNGSATSLGVNQGVIADTICLPFNDFEALHSFFQSDLAHQTAAVIVEPIAGNMGVVLPQDPFLQLLREETARVGALLIFDEVITGFRVGLKGAAHLYGIDPDLTCLGKVIGGGFPAAAVGGKARFMDCLAPLGEVYQAGTLSGNPVAMRAGYTTLCLIEQEGFYEKLEQKTRRLVDPIQSLIERLGKQACVQRCGSMLTLFLGLTQVGSQEDLKRLDPELFAAFFRYLFDRGIYIPPAAGEAWFVSAAHTNEQLDYTSQVISEFLHFSLL